jgi:ferredoxin-NADP reductase
LKDKSRRHYTLSPSPGGPTNGVQFTVVLVPGPPGSRIFRSGRSRKQKKPTQTNRKVGR